MLVTIATTHRPATDLGFLLHKHPDRLHTVELSFGRAHVFYPEANESRCTAALLLEVDPVGLVRRRAAKPEGEAGMLQQYVNDRPYVASSFMSVALSKAFGTALGGRSKERPELASTPIPLEARIASLPCRGGESVLRSLFEPLGYAVEVRAHPLDPRFPEWGAGTVLSVELRATSTLRELLTHLYVLIPVLDDEKHYWVDDAEVQKLLRHGGDWLAAHPRKELVVNRYRRGQRRLAREALARLLDEDQPEPDVAAHAADVQEATLETDLSLNEQRVNAVLSALRASGAGSVIDLGCGEGRLLRELLRDRAFQELLVNYPRRPRIFVRAIENVDAVTSEYHIRDRTDREQGVATEVEEIVIAPHLVDANQIGKQGADPLLQRTMRGRE